ncbi:PREDICTED: uncharacterized protein LOC107348871 isoform X3 [Acropora digitifera]|uniref:uncharacterized protein LOC107348871 isoform X2 n=1 Tax=Acropora digitifera TaxID=70779 RepID=UPI00077A0B43|nr:PREDICTED: uncharacterized protein LOC107348871 isoform X2 [Acropora digitifera]XP_015770418.1 PREDICTED: uncharacterized protein LOC107348871 isoform X2 [Acropora digitifera]XP_015770419.1 PREDICTED: uncharacterized protein LOC107348871 isoform X2 [Acropora digitifera]XP_015770420.1 PREDICTED: uncharacterized protein LOC107348871 isoform X2 [Acropora digitifera]XP_015770421.1 PREDICTED: uncharacterized protein LOC107348871 isoform X3 [Acropora digitifera]XP_015770422.1 PREDICTED: uncharact
MIEELLLRFSRENFDDANYVPLLHGHSETAKPLSLIIKQKRSIWKHRYSFAKDEITFLAGLENFVSRHCEKKYLDAVELKVIEEQVMEKGENSPVDSHTEIDLNIADIGDIKLTADDNLGDLQLGKVRQEYILDPDLRGILSCTVLDADKMIPYQDQELFLITSVVYSEKFDVVGKRKQEWKFEAGLEPPSQFSKVLKSKLYSKYKESSTPPGFAKRNAWGPILVNYCPVQYNKEKKTLEIMKGEFVGKSKFHGDAEAFVDDHDYNNEDVDNDDGQVPVDVVADNILPDDDFTAQEMKNIQRIHKNVLMTTNSREQQKALVKKYLKWFEHFLADDKMKILLDHRQKLTSNDCTFLRSLYVPASLDQDTLDFTKQKKAEIHRYGFILKLIDELSDEEWKELGLPSK